MRFEAKNKECKQDAQNSNFKNVCKTVAEQHQRRHCISLHDLFCKSPVTVRETRKFIYACFTWLYDQLPVGYSITKNELPAYHKFTSCHQNENTNFLM